MLLTVPTYKKHVTRLELYGTPNSGDTRVLDVLFLCGQKILLCPGPCFASGLEGPSQAVELYL